MSDPSFNPGRYCGDAPLPPPDNKAIDDMFTPSQRDALRKMIKEEISKATGSESKKTGIFARPLKGREKE